MKKNVLAKECIVIVLIFIVTIIFFGISGFALPSVYDNTYLGEFKDKIALIEKPSDKKRIIFVGGSAVAFGINSQLIDNNLPDYEAVNFGLYASLGSKLMMESAKKNVRNGDIVVLMLEQDNEMLSSYFNGKSTWQAMDGNLSNLKYVDYDNYSSLLSSYPEFALSKIKYNLNPLDITGIYQKSSFNEFGDIDSSLRNQNIMLPHYYDEVNPIHFDESVIESDFIDYLNEYNQQIKNLGGEVVYYFPPMNDKSLINDSYLAVDDYFDYLNSRLDFEIISNPHNSIMDSLWFYDTNYHLNASGSIVYTKQVIQDLKILLKDSSKTDISLPDQPEPMTNINDGDNSDADKFDYEETENEIYLTSLKDHSLTKVILPYRINEKLVSSFSRDLFKDNQQITEIVIQDNITKIEDYSFLNTDKLTKIIIKQDNPNYIKIGSHLLDETNAEIYVSKKALSSYLSDYSWNMYASRIMSYD